ncbi:CobQ/CobB/MinD/ParA nucleotide binding domain-containing protein [Belnapia rosea]|uniref:CobQ/CobB/MinD/ParA nucleotide binding domain-containing protein n=2 Tax=Belnapia rosea TaxID=938405 RepID=A0A1G7ALW7_9PROT|nr:CobQ/CobB/MinD/ParA nucleotide binding domain-containing protein [Belnapia rosea]
MLGAEPFKALVASASIPKTIRSFLQGYLQNTGPGPIDVYKGPSTNPNVHLVAGDFWLNVYSDALSVGNDLLTGNGIAKFVALRTLERKLSEEGCDYDYVLIDLPPSFGGLVRSALYSSDYLVIPCTSDTFSEYCIGLIAQMLPQFVADWQNGLVRFKANNYGSVEYDQFGRPVFAGWVFNGFDTRDGKLLRADDAHFQNITKAIDRLTQALVSSITVYDPVVHKAGSSLLGKIEDMNVLIQNSLWQNIPAAKLDKHQQVKDLTGGKSSWSDAQKRLIVSIRNQIDDIAKAVISKL